MCQPQMLLKFGTSEPQVGYKMLAYIKKVYINYTPIIIHNFPVSVYFVRILGIINTRNTANEWTDDATT